MPFNSNYHENRPRAGDDFAFVFAGSNLLVSNDRVPTIDELPLLSEPSVVDNVSDGRFFGNIGEKSCYAYYLPEDFNTEPYAVSGDNTACGYSFVLLRRYIAELDESICAAAGYASHLLHWDRHSRFCGRCGAENRWHKPECAKKCPVCGNLQYPKISPAIIILIRKGDDILLAHNRRFPKGRYSVLAGFMEIGETVEETAAREVFEECGIRISNIKYVSSQSWPFPDSLMIGLTADYESGELKPDGEEIIHAGWYNPDNFPSIPGPGTIARKLIDEYTKT